MNPVALLANAAVRRLDQMFPGYFTGSKHNHYADFGYPTALTFDLLHSMYSRNGIAKAAVDKTVGKTWETNPLLQEKRRDGSEGATKKETRREALIRQRFEDLRLWQKIAECDRRGLVGRYAGLILRIADGQNFDQPVETVSAGLLDLVEIIPAWEGQLKPSSWDTDEKSETFGQPTMFTFSESQVAGSSAQPRSLTIHPDRVVIWSADGTVNCQSALEAGYNDLIDMEKVKGAGGEGFWKNAKASPYLEIDKDAKLDVMAKSMGIKPEDLVEKMNDQVEDFQKGFDKVLMAQGMTVKPMAVTLPASPEHYFLVPLQSFAASFRCPLKILVGSQSGERASTEDAAEWAKTNMSRRANIVIPGIMELIRRLERFGIIPERDWFLDWADLTEASPAEKIDRVVKMAEVNAKAQTSGERIFKGSEMRGVVDLEPLSDADAKVEPPAPKTDPNANPPGGDPAKPATSKAQEAA